MDVNRITPTDDAPLRFHADVRIACADCREAFRFLGCESGLRWDRPMVSIDGLELRAPIEPEGIPMLSQRSTFEMPPEVPRD